DLADVGVQPRLPAAVAGAPAELNDQLAAVELPALPAGLVEPALEPRLAADVLQVAAHPLHIDRRPGDQEHGGAGLVHRAVDATSNLGRSRRAAAGHAPRVAP